MIGNPKTRPTRLRLAALRCQVHHHGRRALAIARISDAGIARIAKATGGRDGGFRHYRIVREGASRERLPPRVAGYQGYEKREVLEVEEAERLFEDFLAGRRLGPGFEAFDVDDLG